MTDHEHDQLRREVKHLIAELAEAGHGLLLATRSGVVTVESAPVWRSARGRMERAINAFDVWKRRAAGPEDLARLDAAMREDAEVR